MMRKLLTLTLAVLLVGLFAAVVFAAVESGDGSSSTTFGTTDTTDTTETTGTTETTTTPGDISGPCDEPEHAGDPRCTGVGDDHRGGDDDSSGPGPGGDDSGHGGDDFDSSGPGGGGDSGRGRGRGRGGDDD